MAITNPTDISGCIIWLAADMDSYADNDPVGTAVNGGSGGDWTASGSNRPTYKTSITPTTKPVYRFDGSDDFLTGPDNLSGLTAGSAFIVVKIVTDPPASSNQSGLWTMGTQNSMLYPFTDGKIYEDCLIDTRPDTGDPTLDLASAFRVYTVTAASGDFNTYLDGTLHFNSTTSITVAASPIPRIGASGAGGGSPTFRLEGDIAAFIVYDTVLSSGDRGDVTTYLTNRYISASPPPPPTGGGTIFQSSIIG